MCVFVPPYRETVAADSLGARCAKQALQSQYRSTASVRSSANIEHTQNCVSLRCVHRLCLISSRTSSTLIT